MPIPFKVNKETYYLPTSWGDLYFWQLLQLKDNAESGNQLVGFLMQCAEPIDATEAAPFLEWLQTPFTMADFEPSTTVGDIKRQAWSKKLAAHAALRQDSTVAGMAGVVSAYVDGDCTKLQLFELAPMYLEITEQLAEIIEVEHKTLYEEPTMQQVQAGIGEFERLGQFNAIDEMAGGDPLKYDAILAIEYGVIYSKMLKNKISNTFTKRLQTIYEEEAKQKAKKCYSSY